MYYSERLAALPLYGVWQSLPNLKETIDPFEFVQRMAAYKLLIDCCNDQRVFGKENEFNLFWGYVFQLDWQWRSGRLQFKDTAAGRIAATSSWGYANYSLSIIPLVAAMQSGITPEKEILAVRSPLQHIGRGGTSGPFRIPERFNRPLQEWREFSI